MSIDSWLVGIGQLDHRRVPPGDATAEVISTLVN